MTLPGNIVTLLIQVICFVEHKTVQGHKDTVGQTRPEAGAIGQL